jgi:dipeptidase
MCTTLIVTKGASIDGSIMVAHSDDDEMADQRIIYIPAQDHEQGAMRQIFAQHILYPRILTNERGPNYQLHFHSVSEPTHLIPDLTKPIGYIPQVKHTYAYFDGNYGIMNEHNLMIGECTNGAKYQPEPITAEEAEKTGKHIRLFYSQELSHIALERCKNARGAVELLGILIDKYGVYSTGETLLVADENEAWVFEMCALPDEQYHSVWVAQRVPEGEVFVAANEFRIRRIQENHKDFLYSELLKPGLEKLGWWNPKDGPLDWLSSVSYGEFNHPYFSLRRVWRVLDRINPDLALSPWVTKGFKDIKDGSYATDYPFSIKPKNPLSLRDVFALYRDHYEGTEFDLTKGIAAGPYGDPNRSDGPYDGAQNNITENQHMYGAWERPISACDQGYSYVTQLRPKISEIPEATRGLCWFGPDVAYTTCFVPFPSKVLELPKSFQTGNPQIFDGQSAWWAFDFVANWARLNYQRMTKVDILPLQQEIEAEEFQKTVHQWDKCCKGKSDREAREILTRLSEENANEVIKKWHDLGNTLITKYSNGYCNLRGEDKPQSIGYSSEWLVRTNYKNGPTSYEMKP